MANTIDTALIQDSISAKTQTVLANRLAPLNLFASDFSADVKKKKETILVDLQRSAASTQVNPTTFNDIGGTELDKVSVTLDHVYQPFGLSYADLQNNIRLERLIQINIDAIADKIWALATAPITIANFGSAVLAENPTIANGGLATLWAAIHKARRKGVVLNPTAYSGFIPTSAQALPLAAGAYGFENGVHFASSFGGEAGLLGFACAPQAVAIASAQPELVGKYDIAGSVALDDLGMEVFYTVYTDQNSRATIASLEVMFGAAAGVTEGTMALIVD